MTGSLPGRVLRLFKGFFSKPHPEGPRRRLDDLPFSLHLFAGTSSVELFPPGPLDVLRFYQRHHASLRHELEYVVCRPLNAQAEEYRAYAVFRLVPEERIPLVDLRELERTLRRSYGTLIHLPRARPLLDRQYSDDDLTDEDPPEGLNHVRVPSGEKVVRGRLTVAEVIDIMRKELDGPELIAWLEGAFRQPPKKGVVEHRYYLDATAGLYLVRDHFAEGKTLYRAETSDVALRPERRGR